MGLRLWQAFRDGFVNLLPAQRHYRSLAAEAMQQLAKAEKSTVPIPVPVGSYVPPGAA